MKKQIALVLTAVILTTMTPTGAMAMEISGEKEEEWSIEEGEGCINNDDFFTAEREGESEEEEGGKEKENQDQNSTLGQDPTADQDSVSDQDEEPAAEGPDENLMEEELEEELEEPEAETISDWTGLKSAVEAAGDGDRICISEDVVFPETLRLEKNLTFEAAVGSETVTLYAGGSYRHFDVTGRTGDNFPSFFIYFDSYLVIQGVLG